MINNNLSSLQSYIQSLKETKQQQRQLTITVEELEKARQLTDQALLSVQHEKDQLEKATAKDEAILTSIGDALIAVSQNREIFLFNKAASQLTGYFHDEVINHHFDEFIKFVEEQSGDPIPNFMDLLLSGHVNKRMALITKMGKRIPVTVSIAPILSPIGSIQGAVIVLRDVTRDRQIEHMKDEFVSIASHELRTPMTAIKGLLSMILEGDYGKIPTEAVEPLTDVENSTNRLIALVNDMLDVSRIEAGRIKIMLGTFELPKMINEVTTLLHPIAQQKQIILEARNIAPVNLQVDTDKFKQILSNLIGNALKFTEKGSIVVTSAVDGDMTKIYVTDTGMGITDKDQKLLFGKFAQITSQQEGKPPGTGLGLYISRELCRKMGGDLWIEHSVIGQGSVFAFSIPVAKTPTAQTTAENLAKQPSSIT